MGIQQPFMAGHFNRDGDVMSPLGAALQSQADIEILWTLFHNAIHISFCMLTIIDNSTIQHHVWYLVIDVWRILDRQWCSAYSHQTGGICWFQNVGFRIFPLHVTWIKSDVGISSPITASWPLWVGRSVTIQGWPPKKIHAFPVVPPYFHPLFPMFSWPRKPGLVDVWWPPHGPFFIRLSNFVAQQQMQNMLSKYSPLLTMAHTCSEKKNILYIYIYIRTYNSSNSNSNSNIYSNSNRNSNSNSNSNSSNI